jgi:hypothetical protein
MAEPENFERVDWHLENWKRYMLTGQYQGLRMPGRACAGMGISHTADFDQLADAADLNVARAVDAIIRDLKPLEAKALRCRYLHEQWTSVLSMAAVVVVAMEGVRTGLNRRGIV